MKNIIYFFTAITFLLASCNTANNKNTEKEKLDSIAKADSLKKEKNKSDTLLVSDIDGNVYHTITIGAQVWMIENLKVSHYRNGDSIINIKDDKEWKSLKTGACCDYNNIPDSSKIYGKLYNWYAVHDKRNLAPKGWHVPTNAEWSILINFLGGESSGGKMKETSEKYWNSPNVGATNESGFTALPSGYRKAKDGIFIGIWNTCEWWSSTKFSATDAWSRTVENDDNFVVKYLEYIEAGISVRCIKDK